MRFLFGVYIFLFGLNTCLSQPIQVGAEQPCTYLPLLTGKRVGLVVNQTSRVDGKHLLDFLLEKKVEVCKVFSPEHGFRGGADAGQKVKDQIDEKTGLPVISLYGENKKPTEKQLADLDILVFDIQDVGVRFYTYISTMHYVMEACAENKKQLIVFDRPNPNGNYVAGPVLKTGFKSFVGMHPIPVVHGCTIGEMAQMINGEGWLKGSITCELEIVKVKNYSHDSCYSLPVKPSPNLPTDLSIRLYPSLCFFEATHASIGRGTIFPFQVMGYPDPSFGNFSFTPQSIAGMAMHPKQEGKLCYGVDFRGGSSEHRFSLSYWISFYSKFEKEEDFLSSERWFNLLAGTDQLINDVRSGKSLEQIEQSWQTELNDYMQVRKKYLLYPDFKVRL